MSNIKALRQKAFLSQNGRCHYCGCPMWEHDPTSFAKQHGISLKTTRRLQSTAEHLIARQDGGSDTAGNVVAACLHCNAHRHLGREASAPSAERYRARVQMLVSRGRWPTARFA